MSILELYNQRLISTFAKSISKSLDFISNPTFLVYTLLPIVPLLIIAILSTDPYLWIGSDINHFYIELFAVVFSGVLGFYYILHARILNDKFSLFVGIGFSVSAALDLFHVVVSYSMMENIEFLKYFIPQTWFAGRIFLSCMLLIAVVKYSSSPTLLPEDKRFTKNKDTIPKDTIPKDTKFENKDQTITSRTKIRYSIQKNLFMYLIFLAGLASIIAFTSLYIVYPASFLDDYSLHRPYEIPPLILFSLTLFYFYKKKLYLKKDVIYKGILIYLIVDIFSQIIMAYSTAPFDTSHNFAHVLKNVGYFVNIIALALSSIQYTIALKERNRLIQNQYEKIKESEKMKDEFINIAAHELRTPIQPILALSIFLYNRKGTIEEHKEHIEIIIKNSKRLQKLSEEILDAAKIESHSLNLVYEKFDLVEMVSKLIKDYISHIENTAITIRFFNDGKEIDLKRQNAQDNYTVSIFADKSRITQVLSNLLSNSIKFTENGEIDIVIEEISSNKEISIKIKDSGPGISKEVLPKLFEKFITGSPSGTGLGLYICKNIIKAHGGNIWAKNNQDNIGVTFTFTLPINKQ